MRFDGEALAIECGPHPDVRRGTIPPSFDYGFRCVDAILRQAFLLGHEIQRRHDEFASLACASFDFSRKRKRAAQQTRRIFHAPIAHCAAHGGARDDYAVLDYWRHNLHFKITAPPEFFEQLHVASLLVTEAKILPDNHCASTQRFEQKLPGEVFGGDFCELRIESQYQCSIET